MRNVYDILEERGFIEQSTGNEEIRELLSKPPVSFYIGFDATADSLHVGHFIQVIVMMHMQKAGHRPIALLGGGTTMVGDPSGRTDMRKMLTIEDINSNCEKFKAQLSRFIDFNDKDGAMLVNNADWLLPLNYIEFLRDYGKYFSVNHMLAAECFKARMEKGLSFLEFNYMLMQAYDFLELYRRHNVLLEMGGNDQWSNILAGRNLIHRVEGAPAHALTFKLLTNSEGKKMGKTEKGAVWIDPEKTSPYEFFQYWRNIDDNDVANCLALLTFIPMDEVRAITNMEAGADINKAKERLAYEVTLLVHGKDAADNALSAAKALFGGGGDLSNMPTTSISAAEIKEGINIITLLTKCGLVKTNSEARRLINDGGVYYNNERVTGIDMIINDSMLDDGNGIIRKGKKVFHRIVIED